MISIVQVPFFERIDTMGKDLKGKELGKGILQRKDGKYCARYQDRFGNRKSVYGDTLKDVRNKMHQGISDDMQKRNIVNEKTTLSEWYTQWMEVYKIPVIRVNTKRHYEHIYKTKIEPILGNEKLTEINKLKITALINKLNNQGYQWETLNKVRVLLIDMFNKALEDEFVIRNPAKGVRLPKNRPSNQIKALSKDDQKTFLECSSGTFYHNLFLVALNTGLRPGELFALTEDNLNFKKKEIYVTNTLLYQKLDGDEKKTFHLGEPKTYSSIRTVPINNICEAALLSQIRIHKIIYERSPYKSTLQFPNLLFTTKYCTPLNSVLYSAAIDKIVDEINLMRDSLDQMERFSGHTFRHTFATRCFEAGIEPKTVQSFLGHATLQMTMDLYTSVMPQKKKSDMDKLESTIDIEAPDISEFKQADNDRKIIHLCS